jgi:hypothetical protein
VFYGQEVEHDEVLAMEYSMVNQQTIKKSQNFHKISYASLYVVAGNSIRARPVKLVHKFTFSARRIWKNKPWFSFFYFILRESVAHITCHQASLRES